ncbi:hypothetical protein [Sphingomonas sp. BK580]|uniref:hypothetical protein n=1 Tax=Sphingomonas sp. BK580 TaxID=2586972 RepID=UPI00161B2361|nr:hypothetical protein [Sphingomonas sp. BK580]MBB3692771.1 hypothetical protein [Sphingomonas sp. BK580]
MPGRNLPPRYRVITRDSEPADPAPRAGSAERRWDEEAFGGEPPAAAPTIIEQPPSWPLIGLFLLATAAGGAAAALLGLVPDVLL